MIPRLPSSNNLGVRSALHTQPKAYATALSQSTGLCRKKNPLFQPRVVVASAPPFDLICRFDASRRGACEDTRERLKDDDQDCFHLLGSQKRPDRPPRPVGAFREDWM